jgi:hypothetical protein
MVSAEYRANRPRVAWADLERYRGHWVAFSADGRRVVAGAETLDQLEEALAALGEAGPEDDTSLGGVEFL